MVASVRYPNGRVGTLDNNLQDPDSDNPPKPDDWMDVDSTRPLEGNCEIKLLQFNDLVGKETFWHSTAHVLGSAMEQEFGVQLTHGPPTTDGFFYDGYSGKDMFSEKNYAVIEKLAKKISGADQKF